MSVSEFSWPYRFNTARDSWILGILLATVFTLIMILIQSRLILDLIAPARSADTIFVSLIILCLWLFFIYSVFEFRQPVRGEITSREITVEPVRFLGIKLRKSSPGGAFTLNPQSLVQTSLVSKFRNRRAVIVAVSISQTEAKAFHIATLSADRAEQLASFIARSTGMQYVPPLGVK